jgi:hypothetical protein
MPADTSHPHGEVFLDVRGEGRAMRLTWHHEADVVVLSLWRDRDCAGSFRLSAADVSDFVDALVDGLRDAPSDDMLPAGPQPLASRKGAIDVAPPPIQHAATDEDGAVEWVLPADAGRASA